MRIPAWVLVTAAVLLALPVGWGFGVVLAYALVGGSDIGVLPALTIPISTVGAIVFALWPSFAPLSRLATRAIATVALVASPCSADSSVDKQLMRATSRLRAKSSKICSLQRTRHSE